jgi:hypothetical protein
LDLCTSERIEYLLNVVWLNQPRRHSIHLTCSNQSCLQEFEIEFSQEDLTQLNQSRDVLDHSSIQINGTTLNIRRPTGRDQLKWLEDEYPDEDAAITNMIRTLVADENPEYVPDIKSMNNQELQTINDALEELDPLLNFKIKTNCPYCNSQETYRLDLEKIALMELEKTQLYLVKDIHRLASFYHWSEDQIFSIPPARRSQYLHLIQADKQ